MSDNASPPAFPQALIQQKRRIPVIWVIPLVAIAIGAWLAWDTLSKEGPTITVTFESAEGLQSGQSQLKFKDIALGTVNNLELSVDHTHVIVTIKTTKQATSLLTDQTSFWVVKPRLFAGNLSGLRYPPLRCLHCHAAAGDRRQVASRVHREREPAGARS